MQGDEALAEKLVERMGAQHPVFAVAALSPRRTTVASVGASLDADFEIGSVSKGITGLLYADALERGHIGPTTTLGDLLPLGTGPAARVTLSSISTHRSGLPSLPSSAGVLRRTLALWLKGANPYGDTLDQLIAQAQGVRLKGTRPRYSNFGFELLGHALAAAASTTFGDLLRDRVATPLGLDTFYAPATPDELRPGALTGRSKSGRGREPWTGEALAPAGGIRSTIQDMARLTAALLDGSAPGVGALDPVADYTGRVVRIGAAWITLDRNRRLITWHNGGTGGFRTWLGLDRAAGTAVVLLSATAVSVDQHGFTLLAQLTEDEGTS
ncbi:beta-lactamase [Saccharothrix espanaensis DSM 44229]|uniref:Beta-lactamase n=1 Tax=Saccharothrix espanaensis (strain ATCC 51144 / DSM 44229 / JCM 9112 / NBRC 15066 / NRRL 15764) TaxID=1179773 RepID=K0K5P0_SACES|nr:beta-lactamase [Saccharothrix espanaensis DSM 44229]